jgi:NADH-quinone oxidoreductase subunit L
MWDPIFYWALAALAVPLGAALVIALCAPLRRRGTPAAWLSIVAAAFSFAAAIVLFAGQVNNPLRLGLLIQPWLPDGSHVLAQIGLRLDGISIPMLLVLTTVALCVQVFSLGYMAEEPAPARGRYFAYHSLFIFAMGVLVLAPNMLELFIGWELVGLTSYLLIGYYYQKPSAARAAIKAFWVTKFADMGLVLGVVLLYAKTGTFSWHATLPVTWAAPITLLMFLGVMGKSAQFPLHVWLPNAMEGPTPVSALLHAATMVAAGVYLIVRANPLFAQSHATMMAMAYIGGFTALFAAIVACVQTDIKRVLAYSTCSQLGYMICALGAGSVMGGFFHLTTHAFFKALLFLAAGSVIHAVGSNELDHMGGLVGKMKLTSGVFIVAAAALAGIPGFAGFFSKDLILEAVQDQHLWLPYAALMAAAFLTAFYISRVIFLGFLGNRSKHAEHAHEGGWSMALPMLLLAAGSIGVGWFGVELSRIYNVDYQFQFTATGFGASGLAFAGIAVAWLLYGRVTRTEAFDFVNPVGVLARSGVIDRLFEDLYRNGLLALSAAAGWFDRYIVDGVINLSGWATITAGRKLKRLQTGNAQDYVLAVLAGAVVLTAWELFR